MCAGSVTADHTFSIGAAIRIVRRTAKRPSSTTDGLIVMLMMILVFGEYCNCMVA